VYTWIQFVFNDAQGTTSDNPECTDEVRAVVPFSIIQDKVRNESKANSEWLAADESLPLCGSKELRHKFECEGRWGP
jgi:hypothetical protein